MGANDAAIDIVEVPVHMAGGLGLLWPGVQDLPEDTSLLPAGDTAGHRAPRSIALRHIAPGRAGAQDPLHAIQDAPMVDSRSANIRCWGAVTVAAAPMVYWSNCLGTARGTM